MCNAFRFFALLVFGSISFQFSSFGNQDFNRPSPELGAEVQALQHQISTSTQIKRLIRNDRSLKALYVQTLNHLQHVSWSFRMRDDTYTHDFVIAGPYPKRPTEMAIQKAKEFLSIVLESAHTGRATLSKDLALEADLRKQQKDLVKKITTESFSTYQEMSSRIQLGGVNVGFPELGPVILQLKHTLETNDDIQMQCIQSIYLDQFREKTIQALSSVIKTEDGVAFPYLKTLDAIQKGTEFLDVFQRGFDPDRSPKLYHAARYEYYDYFLKGEIPEHIILPNLTALGATDILKIRGVPISFVGINLSIEWVDGFYQTSEEFRFHDINHSRRMWQFFKEEAARRNMSILEFARYSDHFVKTVLMPMILIKNTDPEVAKNIKRLKKILLYEMNHEDALPATPEVIKTAVLRPPNLITPFEMIEGNTVSYVMEPGATTLAYTYRKLAHDFYDMPGARVDNIVAPAFRTRENIITVADELLNDLGMPVDKKILEYYVSTDQGFPNDFKRTIKKDIESRPEETKPLDEDVPLSESNIRERIADRFHQFWQRNSGFPERWKLAQAVFVDGRGINDNFQIDTQAKLENYFIDKNIRPELHRYFSIKTDPLTGANNLYEDIQHLPHPLLAPNLQFENIMGANQAANLIESISENKIEFRNPDEGIAWIEDGCEKMNSEWLKRNWQWAKDFPEYNRAWKNLTAGKKANGVAYLKIALEVESEAYPNRIASSQKALLKESLRRVELEIQKSRDREVRVELSGQYIHELWRENSGYKERWKPVEIRLNNGARVTNEKTLRIYFAEQQIPETFHSYFAFRVSAIPGAPTLIQDIQNLPFQYLAPIQQKENLDAASSAITIVDRIWNRRVSFENVEQAERWIKAACAKTHQEVLNRNANQAQENPLYNKSWPQIPPINQGHDLSHIHAAIETRLRLNPGDMNETQKEILRKALENVKMEIFKDVVSYNCNTWLKNRGKTKE